MNKRTVITNVGKQFLLPLTQKRMKIIECKETVSQLRKTKHRMKRGPKLKKNSIRILGIHSVLQLS